MHYTSMKTQVAQALSKITGVLVTGSYSKGIANPPCIIYKELVNQPVTGNERLVRLHYSVDIYSSTSTTSLAEQVSKALVEELGLFRGICVDLEEPGGLYHKNMKFNVQLDTLTLAKYRD